MVQGFYEDLAKAKKGEAVVFQVLSGSTWDYDFKLVADKREYFHKGDIEAYDSLWDCSYYIDVKDDSCICRTGNLLAEHRVWYSGTGWCEGFMQNSSYDYVAYLSQADHKIYMLDFELWKKHYMKHYKKHLFIPHDGAQTTDGYLMPLYKARELGIVVAEIDYKEENGSYFLVGTKKIS